MPASAHNLYVKGDFTYQANYRYGLHILDTSDPLNPVEVGHFDTSPYQTDRGSAGHGVPIRSSNRARSS